MNLLTSIGNALIPGFQQQAADLQTQAQTAAIALIGAMAILIVEGFIGIILLWKLTGKK